jgi:hypothetical protein
VVAALDVAAAVVAAAVVAEVVFAAAGVEAAGIAALLLQPKGITDMIASNTKIITDRLRFVLILTKLLNSFLGLIVIARY